LNFNAISLDDSVPLVASALLPGESTTAAFQQRMELLSWCSSVPQLGDLFSLGFSPRTSGEFGDLVTLCVGYNSSITASRSLQMSTCRISTDLHPLD